MEEMFLLANPKSGGLKGKDLLQVPQPFPVRLRHGQTVSLRIFSMLDGESGNKPGYRELKKAVAASGGRKLRAIVAGGDGSIMWAVTEMEKHGIDPQSQVIIGVLPLGTGNDFSRALGWGGKNPKGLLENSYAKVKAMVQAWSDATPRPHDVFNVRIEVEPEDGEILQVGDDREKHDLDSNVLDKSMINYFDVGPVGRAGMGFDTYRTKSQLLNNAVYGYEIFYNSLPCRTQRSIGDYLGGLYHGTSARGTPIFETHGRSRAPQLRKEADQSLIFSNIPSYAGGNSNLWIGASRLGVDAPLDPQLMQAVQDPGDGKLEVVTVHDLLAFVETTKPLEGVDKVGAKRIFSGAPLYLDFLHDEDDEVVTYTQIDGEFYKLINPICGTITQKLRLSVLHSETDSAQWDDDEESVEDD